MQFATVLAALIASCAPALLAYSVSPSATFLNQAAAVVGWGVFLWVALSGSVRLRTTGEGEGGGIACSGGWALCLALALLTLAAVGAGTLGGLPLAMALSSGLMILATTGTAWAGMAVARTGHRAGVFQALAWGILVSGLLAVAVGGVQVFAPEWADGQWIAVSALEGRATGNLRQPNHLGTMLLWAVVAAVVLVELNRQAAGVNTTQGGAASPSPRQDALPARSLALWAAVTWLVLGIVLSASRTGAVGLFLLAAWGLLDARLSRPGRAVLIAAPFLYALLWWALTAWADATGHAFGGAARFSVQGDISSSRFGVWSNTVALIAQHPWTGVGWGGFNFAWSLTPFPHRPVAFFDHTHNLLLQFAVELGLPLAGLVVALLGWAFWRAAALAWRAAPGPHAVVLRGGWVMLLLMALHSQLEYPLWYAYFLLPTAFVWGLCLVGAGNGNGGGGGAEGGPLEGWRAEPGASGALADGGVAAGGWCLRALRVAAALMALVGVASLVDYRRAVVIFAPPARAAPLDERIASGERSFLFAHHAYYAAATTAPAPEAVMPAFQVATHHLLDTRLMIAWAKALDAQGDVERARHLAQRLREFHNVNSEAFFAPCLTTPSPKPLPFQCTAPAIAMDYRDFLP